MVCLLPALSPGGCFSTPSNLASPLLPYAAPSGAAADRGQLLVFDDATFDRVAAFPLAAQELPCSLTSVVFAGDDTPYYALGTAVVKPEEYEPSKGRLLLLAYRWAVWGWVAGEEWWGPALRC